MKVSLQMAMHMTVQNKDGGLYADPINIKYIFSLFELFNQSSQSFVFLHQVESFETNFAHHGCL